MSEATLRPRRSAPSTYWRFRRAPCYRVIVRIGASRTPETAWSRAKGLVGTERAAVQVWPDGLTAEPFYVDDIDGSGWNLVTTNRGDPAAPHRLLDVSEVLKDLTEY
jgi:hypothetical protein